MLPPLNRTLKLSSLLFMVPPACIGRHFSGCWLRMAPTSGHLVLSARMAALSGR